MAQLPATANVLNTAGLINLLQHTMQLTWLSQHMVGYDTD